MVTYGEIQGEVTVEYTEAMITRVPLQLRKCGTVRAAVVRPMPLEARVLTTTFPAAESSSPGRDRFSATS